MDEHCPSEQRLSAYHDGELDGDARAEVEAHLASCGACERRLGELRRTSAWFDANRPAGLSMIALRRVHQRVDEAMERGLVRLGWELSAVAAAVLLCGSVWLARAGDVSPAVVVPPWVGARASVDPIVSTAATPAAAWYLVGSSANDGSGS